MTRALLIVDVQNDFCEGGNLAVTGGHDVARRITDLLTSERGYDVVVASRDWHDADSSNGGHFDDWPAHCVAGTEGAAYAAGLDTTRIDVHVRKGQGRPAYSAFQGVSDDGQPLAAVLAAHAVTDLDVCGIATDYCVRASSLDARHIGLSVRLLPGMHAGVAPDTSETALREMREAGVEVTE